MTTSRSAVRSRFHRAWICKAGWCGCLIQLDFKGQGGKVKGGSATVLDLPLRQEKELKSLLVRTLANEVVIGMMAVTLVRD